MIYFQLDVFKVFIIHFSNSIKILAYKKSFTQKLVSTLSFVTIFQWILKSIGISVPNFLKETPGLLVTVTVKINIWIINYNLAAEPQRTRFFTGNNALDAGAAGAALGVGAQYFANQIFNPCTRGGTRNNNRGTNNRIFGGQTLQNGALGFLAGFAGAALVNNAQGNPCGR